MKTLQKLRGSGSQALSPLPFLFAALIMLALIVVGTPGLPGVDDEPVMLLLGFLFGVFLIWNGLNDFMLLRFVRDTPTSDIAAMASGDVEVIGEARQLDGTLKAPLSGKDCLAYEYTVEQYEPGDQGSREIVDSGSSDAVFAVDDGTDVAAIKPDGADLVVDWDVVEPGEGEGTPRPQSGNEPSAAREIAGALAGSEQRTYKEKLIRPGEDIYVFGEASTHAEQGVKLIEEGDNPVYLISNKPEDEIAESFSTWYKLKLPIGLIFSAGCYYGLYLAFI